MARVDEAFGGDDDVEPDGTNEESAVSDDRGAIDRMGAGSHRNLPNAASAEATEASADLSSSTDGTATASGSVGSEG